MSKTIKPEQALAAFTAIITVTAATPCVAQDVGPYGAIGGAYATLRIDENSPKNEFVAVNLRAGYGVHRLVAMEIEGMAGVVDDTLFGGSGPNTFDVSLNMGRSVAAYAVARAPVNENFSVFARAGAHSTKLSLKANGLKESESFENLAFGAGAEYRWNATGLRADYSRFSISDDISTISVFSLSLTRHF